MPRLTWLAIRPSQQLQYSRDVVANIPFIGGSYPTATNRDKME